MHILYMFFPLFQIYWLSAISTIWLILVQMEQFFFLHMLNKMHIIAYLDFMKIQQILNGIYLIIAFMVH